MDRGLPYIPVGTWVRIHADFIDTSLPYSYIESTGLISRVFWVDTAQRYSYWILFLYKGQLRQANFTPDEFTTGYIPTAYEEFIFIEYILER